MSELGTSDWVSLPGTDGGEVYVKHVGPRLAKKWGRALHRLRRDEEERRRRAQRARIEEYGDVKAAHAADPLLFGLELDDAGEPKSWDSGDESAAEQSQTLFDDMVAQTVTDIRGVYGANGKELKGEAAAKARLEYLSPTEAFMLVLLILNQQSLSPRQIFPVASAGDPSTAVDDPDRGADVGTQ